MDVKVRAGVEMAMIDAAAKSVGVPLWKLFSSSLWYSSFSFLSVCLVMELEIL